MLTFGSLFSGCGGFDLGLERAGMRCLWQVENDLYARKILRKHWPRIPKWQDVRNVGATHLAAVDVLAGGFPCTDLSLSNASALGLAGERSGLWREFARLIGELQPRAVIIENGASSRKRWLGTILEDLASLGYDAEWDCVPASALGANHQRDRCFVAAYAQGARREGHGAERAPAELARLADDGGLRNLARWGGGHPRGRLNPEFTEWMMGLPIGWTACDLPATPSRSQSRSSSGGASSLRWRLNLRGD